MIVIGEYPMTKMTILQKGSEFSVIGFGHTVKIEARAGRNIWRVNKEESSFFRKFYCALLKKF